MVSVTPLLPYGKGKLSFVINLLGISSKLCLENSLLVSTAPTPSLYTAVLGMSPYTVALADSSASETVQLDKFTNGISLSFRIISTGSLSAIYTLEAIFLEANPDIRFNFG